MPLNTHIKPISKNSWKYYKQVHAWHEIKGLFQLKFLVKIILKSHQYSHANLKGTSKPGLKDLDPKELAEKRTHNNEKKKAKNQILTEDTDLKWN